MQKLAIASLALVIVLVSLSAYLRLDHSGIGCEPWPSCYGNIGVAESEVTVSDAYERLLEEAQQPMSWARPLHRLVASVLGIAILALALFSVIRKRDRSWRIRLHPSELVPGWGSEKRLPWLGRFGGRFSHQ